MPQITGNNHQGNAATPGSQVLRPTPVMCVCGKKTASRGETSQRRQAGSIACETDKLPLSRHLYPLALLHLHLHRAASCFLSGVTAASLEDCFAMLGGGEVLVNRGIQHFYASSLRTPQLYLFNAGIIPSSHTKVKIGGRSRKMGSGKREGYTG